MVVLTIDDVFKDNSYCDECEYCETRTNYHPYQESIAEERYQVCLLIEGEAHGDCPVLEDFK
jgi:hypothetical protein